MRIDVDPSTFVGASAASVAIPVKMSGTIADSASICRGKLRAGQQAYTKLLDSIYDAVFITDAKGRVIDMNPRALGFFRLAPETPCGFSVLDRISGADEGLLRQIMQNLQDHRFTLLEALCVRSDRTTFPAEIVVNRVDIGGQGQLSFFIRDISVRKEALDKLEAANERLRAHDRARMEFISNVSHELRTPLTSMIYGVESMLRGVVGELNPMARDYVRRLDSDCRRLLNTVNDILDLRMIEAGTLTLAKTLVPLSRLAKGCAETLRIQADERGQTLRVQAPDAGTFALCDAHKVERVIINVIGNAIKFTPDGGVIRVSVHPSPDRPGFVQLVCDDTGPGIPAEAIRRVTERYFRVGEHVAGTGLGLAISREIVELHGGSIDVRSPVPGSDCGTSVHVFLPAASAPTVLVVEDDELVLELLAEEIRNEGYAVLTAASAGAAIETATHRDVGLVVLDVNLPDMNGSQVILELRGRRDRSRLPILAISGTEPAAPVAEILRRFNIPMLTKPWKAEELLARIGTAFFADASRKL
jgi:PAS domain S-box-containing protein